MTRAERDSKLLPMGQCSNGRPLELPPQPNCDELSNLQNERHLFHSHPKTKKTNKSFCFEAKENFHSFEVFSSRIKMEPALVLFRTINVQYPKYLERLIWDEILSLMLWGLELWMRCWWYISFHFISSHHINEMPFQVSYLGTWSIFWSL